MLWPYTITFSGRIPYLQGGQTVQEHHPLLIMNRIFTLPVARYILCAHPDTGKHPVGPSVNYTKQLSWQNKKRKCFILGSTFIYQKINAFNLPVDFCCSPPTPHVAPQEGWGKNKTKKTHTHTKKEKTPQQQQKKPQKHSFVKWGLLIHLSVKTSCQGLWFQWLLKQAHQDVIKL